jgi:hypothetical protein
MARASGAHGYALRLQWIVGATGREDPDEACVLELLQTRRPANGSRKMNERKPSAS